MGFSSAADVAIGLVLVFFLFSVAASKINEAVASKLSWRADGLDKGLVQVIEGGPGLPDVPASSRLTAAKVANHELVKNESSPGKRPQYIRPRAFALTVINLLVPPLHVLVKEIRAAAGDNAAVIDILDHAHDDHTRIANLDATLRPAGGGPPTIAVPDDVRAKILPLLDEAKASVAAKVHGNPMPQVGVSIHNLPDSHPAKRPLTIFFQQAQQDRDKMVAELEDWYNGVMARMSGWYKRKVGWTLLAFGIVLTLAFNVDTVAVATRLYRDSAARQSVVTQAAKSSQPNGPVDAVTSAKSLSIPIGWVNHPHSAASKASYDPRYWPLRGKDVLPKIFGLLLTVGALSFGSKFWFDVLGKIANVRSAGDKPEQRQRPTGSATA